MSEELFAGVDIGGTKISVLITDAKGKILGREKKKSKAEKGALNVLERAADATRDACKDAGVEVSQLRAVGVGAPSPILPDGTAIAAPNLGWKNVPVSGRLKELLGQPVFAANDCNAGTFGEYAVGGHADKKTLVGLFMGTGLGGGLIKDGVLITGENSMAAEVGHMTILPGGRPCGCGKKGCLEAYASKTGMAYGFKQAILLEKQKSVLPDLIEEAGYDNVRSSLLKKAWDAEDTVARNVLTEAATFIGIGVANMITLLGPNVVVLGGGVFEALGEHLLPIVRKAAREHTFPPESCDDTAIELATLGDDAVALGAMAYARSRLN